MIFIFLVLLFVSPSYAGDVGDAIQELCPGAEWVLTGTNYEGLEWLDTKYDKPTKAEVNAAISKIKIRPTLDEKVNALLGDQAAIDQMKTRISSSQITPKTKK